MRLPAAVVVLLLAFPLHAQQDVENARRTVAAIERLLEQRPTDATLWYYLSQYQAQAGDVRASIEALKKVDELGEGFLPMRSNFPKVWGDTSFQAVRSKIEARMPRLDFAPTAFELPDRGMVPEGIAFDAPSRNFFVGSIARGTITRVGEGQATSEFATGLDQVLGLAVDAPRRVLYAVSTSALTEAGRKNLRNAVVAYDVDSRKRLQRHDVPGAVQLNDVAVAPGGRVFASDSGSGAIYEIPIKGPGPVRAVVPPGQIRGTNGLAPSPDGKRLYVAHSTGLSVVDVSGATPPKRVANDTRENVSAIDGLYEWQGQLIGVQNWTNPGRVILVTLSPSGDAVMRVQTMLSHHHNALDVPTTGTVTPTGFYLLAATGVTRYGQDGRIEDADNAPLPTVVRIPLPR